MKNLIFIALFGFLVSCVGGSGGASAPASSGGGDSSGGSSAPSNPVLNVYDEPSRVERWVFNTSQGAYPSSQFTTFPIKINIDAFTAQEQVALTDAVDFLNAIYELTLFEVAADGTPIEIYSDSSDLTFGNVSLKKVYRYDQSAKWEIESGGAWTDFIIKINVAHRNEYNFNRLTNVDVSCPVTPWLSGIHPVRAGSPCYPVSYDASKAFSFNDEAAFLLSYLVGHGTNYSLTVDDPAKDLSWPHTVNQPVQRDYIHLLTFTPSGEYPYAENILYGDVSIPNDNEVLVLDDCYPEWFPITSDQDRLTYGIAGTGVVQKCEYTNALPDQQYTTMGRWEENSLTRYAANNISWPIKLSVVNFTAEEQASIANAIQWLNHFMAFETFGSVVPVARTYFEIDNVNGKVIETYSDSSETVFGHTYKYMINNYTYNDQFRDRAFGGYFSDFKIKVNVAHRDLYNFVKLYNPHPSWIFRPTSVHMVANGLVEWPGGMGNGQPCFFADRIAAQLLKLVALGTTFSYDASNMAIFRDTPVDQMVSVEAFFPYFGGEFYAASWPTSAAHWNARYQIQSRPAQIANWTGVKGSTHKELEFCKTKTQQVGAATRYVCEADIEMK
jgi:hypothetical protein